VDYLELLNYINNETIKFLYITIFLIIVKLLIKLFGDKRALEIFDLIFQRIAEGIMIVSIILLISIYVSYYSEIPLFIINISMLLALGVLYIENRINRSPLMKEININNDINILNNLGKMSNLIKIIIKLFMDVMPRILSIMIVFGMALLTIYPTNELLINVILSLLLYNFIIIIADIVISGIYGLIIDIFRLTTNKTNIDIEKWIK